jgi:hypothetical protein
VPVEVETEESVREEGSEDADDSERIEVHVHVHRGEGSKRPRPKRAAPPHLTGVLFDWQWYRERLDRKTCQAADGSPRARRCQSCDSPVSRLSRRCPRCAAPLGRSRLRALSLALLALGSVGIVFALCAHLLGGSVAEQKPLEPVGQWSDGDYVIVEVPQPAASPFSSTAPAQSAGSSAGPH